MVSRVESDSIESFDIQSEAYYGIQTLKASKNFNITGRPIYPRFIQSIAKIKKAAAIVNLEVKHLDESIALAVIQAAEEVIDGKLNDSFIVDAIQGGAGTSANMNANEVIANRAIEILGGKKGDYSIVHPNDHVNMSQSTNDVIPSAAKLTIVSLLPELISELKALHEAFLKKADEFDDVFKMGRTQLQDAVPMKLGQSFSAFAAVVERDVERLKQAIVDISVLNIGATAIGTSINATQEYLDNIVGKINEICGTSFVRAENLFDGTQNLDGFVHVSGYLKTCAVNLSKISNDLRLLSSGPKTGIGEIILPERQNGSSIMPGKINPVIPEVVNQVTFNIIGNDFTVSMAAEAGQLELNAFGPIIFYKIFESIDTLRNAVKTLRENCVLGIVANRERCLELLESSVGIVTALCPYIGYKKASEIAKISLKTGIPVRKVALEETDLSAEMINEILDYKKLV